MTQRQHPRVVGTSPRNRRATNLWSGKQGVIRKLGIDVNDPDTRLDVNGAITFRQTDEPDNPDKGAAVLWMDDGTYVDDGDIHLRVNVGGTVKTFELVDFVGSYTNISGNWSESGVDDPFDEFDIIAIGADPETGVRMVYDLVAGI
tara:strand:+ start:11048 stop:11485 length:438 start_codon:yes stop_codon:yes gene_type:complete